MPMPIPVVMLLMGDSVWSMMGDSIWLRMGDSVWLLPVGHIDWHGCVMTLGDHPIHILLRLPEPAADKGRPMVVWIWREALPIHICRKGTVHDGVIEVQS